MADMQSNRGDPRGLRYGKRWFLTPPPAATTDGFFTTCALRAAERESRTGGAFRPPAGHWPGGAGRPVSAGRFRPHSFSGLQKGPRAMDFLSSPIAMVVMVLGLIGLIVMMVVMQKKKREE